MINALEQIKQFLVFPSEDTFYDLQIIQRRKENPDMETNHRTVKHYSIKSIEHLERLLPEIISICDVLNARGCINLNRRSYEFLAKQMLKKIPDIYLANSYSTMGSAYESLVGLYTSEPKELRKWIVDIDINSMAVVKEVMDFIDDNNREVIIWTVLKTKNGYHLITTPFRVDEFRKRYPEHEIHRNNPVNLYCP
jgi:hypothetical protein